MTYLYLCSRKTCRPSFKEGNERERVIWWKNSCCHKCSNRECRDYRECDCHEKLLEQMQEQMRLLMESNEWIENILPRIIDSIEELDDDVRFRRFTRDPNDPPQADDIGEEPDNEGQ